VYLLISSQIAWTGSGRPLVFESKETLYVEFLMLNFTRPTSAATATDLVWAFQGRHLVSELIGSLGAPIPLGQLMSDFPTVTDITPVGFLDDKPVYACGVETANLDVLKYTSGNLFALIGRIAGEQFDVIGRAYQLLCWEREHRH